MSYFKTLNGYEIKDAKAWEDIALINAEIQELKNKAIALENLISETVNNMGDFSGDIASVRAVNDKQDGEIAGLTATTNTLSEGISKNAEGIASNAEDIAKNAGDLTAFKNALCEIGVANGGEYYKFYDGTLICLKSIVYENITHNNAWGSMYETAYLSLGNFPMGFIDRPTISLTLVDGSAGFVEHVTSFSNTSAGQFCIARPNSGTATFKVHLTAIGRWK